MNDDTKRERDRITALIIAECKAWCWGGREVECILRLLRQIDPSREWMRPEEEPHG